MGNDELQRAIDDLRARIKPENLPLLERVERRAEGLCLEAQRLRSAITVINEAVDAATRLAAAPTGGVVDVDQVLPVEGL